MVVPSLQPRLWPGLGWLQRRGGSHHPAELRRRSRCTRVSSASPSSILEGAVRLRAPQAASASRASSRTRPPSTARSRRAADGRHRPPAARRHERGAIPRLSIKASQRPKAGIVFPLTRPFDQRRSKDQYGLAIAGGAQPKVRGDSGCLSSPVSPPPVQGLGHDRRFKLGGFEDRAGLGEAELFQASQKRCSGARIRRRASARSSRATRSTCRNPTPTWNRTKVKQEGIRSPISQTMQIYLGSEYVNDFNRSGRTYQVIVQRTRRSGHGRECRPAQGPQPPGAR